MSGPQTGSFGAPALAVGLDPPAQADGPCHRVLHADGGLGGYSGRLDRKRYLLALEGSLPA